MITDDEGQAVLIPAELAFDNIDMEFEITRQGDMIIIRPARDASKDVTLPKQVDLR